MESMSKCNDEQTNKYLSVTEDCIIRPEAIKNTPRFVRLCMAAAFVDDAKQQLSAECASDERRKKEG